MSGPTRDELEAAVTKYIAAHPPAPTADEKRAEIRRWYAGMALQGYLASFAGLSQQPNPEKSAEFAFKCADAMMMQEDL